MPPGLDQLKHIAVLMMENRSFDHLLGSLNWKYPNGILDGLTGNEFNPDTTGVEIKVSPTAQDQGQLEPDPGHHFEDTNTQIYRNPEGTPDGPTMKGFIKAYFEKRQDVNHSRVIMNYFTAKNAPVITS